MIKNPIASTRLILWLSLCLLATAQTDFYVDSEYAESLTNGKIQSPFKFLYQATQSLNTESCDNGVRIILIPRKTPYYVQNTPSDPNIQINSNVTVSNCKNLTVMSQIDGIYDSPPTLDIQGSFKLSFTNAIFKEITIQAKPSSEYKFDITIGNNTVEFANSSFHWIPVPVNSPLVSFSRIKGQNIPDSALTFKNVTFSTLPSKIEEPSQTANFLEMTKTTVTMLNCTVFYSHYKATFDILDSFVNISSLVIQTSNFSSYPLFQIATSEGQDINNMTLSNMKVQLLTDGDQDSLRNIKFSKLGAFFNISDFNFTMENIEIQNMASKPRAPMFQQLVNHSGNRANCGLTIIGLKLYNISLCGSLVSQSSSSYSSYQNITFEKVDIMGTLPSEQISLFEISSTQNVLLKNINFTETIWNYSAQSAFFTISNTTSEANISFIDVKQSEIGSELFIFKNVTTLAITRVEIIESIMKQAFVRAETSRNITITFLETLRSVLCQSTFLAANEPGKLMESLYKFDDGRLWNTYLLNSCDELRLSDINLTSLDLKQQIDNYTSRLGPIENPSSLFSIKSMKLEISNSRFYDIFLFGQALTSTNEAKPFSVLLHYNTFSSFSGLDSSARFISGQNSHSEDESYRVSYGPETNIRYEGDPLNEFALSSNQFSGEWLFEKSSEIIALNLWNVLVDKNRFSEMNVVSKIAFFSSNFTSAQGIRQLNYNFSKNEFSKVTVNSANLLLFSAEVESKLVIGENKFGSCHFYHTFLKDSELMTDSCKIINLIRCDDIIISGNYMSYSTGVMTFVSAVNKGILSSNMKLFLTINWFLIIKDLVFLDLFLFPSSYSSIIINGTSLNGCSSSSGNMITIDRDKNLTYKEDDNSFRSFVGFENSRFSGVTMISLNSQKINNLITVNLPDSSSINIGKITVSSCTLNLDKITLPEEGPIYLMKFFIAHEGRIEFHESTLYNNKVSLHNASLAGFYGHKVTFYTLTVSGDLHPIIWQTTINVTAVEFRLETSEFRSNTAVQGGAFTLNPGTEGRMTLVIQESIFESNLALTYGGVFYIQPNLAESIENKTMITGRMFDNQFMSNYANLAEGGGVLWLNNSIAFNISISDSSISTGISSCFSFVDTSYTSASQTIRFTNLLFKLSARIVYNTNGALISLNSISDNMNTSSYH